MVAQNVTGQSIEIPALNVRGTERGLFRVWASDGLNTASDQSDAAFRIPNHAPAVEITSPAGNTTIATDQTIHLQASAYDPDTGSMTEETLEWRSSLAGHLGNGEQITVTGLRVGNHFITVRADDGEGGTATDGVQVTVVSDISELPFVRVFLPLIAKRWTPAALTKRVLFDEAHDEQKTLSWDRAQLLEPEHPDWVFCGQMAADLAHEFTLVRNPDAPLTAQLLEGYDALIMPEPLEELAESERLAVEQFLTEGGGLLWLGGSDGVANQFSQSRGITFDDRALFEIGGDGDFVVSSFASHPAVAGISRMVTNWGGSLDVVQPAVPLATTGDPIFRDLDGDFVYDQGEPRGPFTIAAAYESGAARFIGVSGAPFQDHGYDWRDNTPLVRALLRWLTARR
jgi:hypothetical protein